ncbi:hypothetical protein TrVFT333_007438 [Trichoderma virens FT-333]|nr:hypothetical protein TrVFT333_007438 [Trichoderma virens FT-333]
MAPFQAPKWYTQKTKNDLWSETVPIDMSNVKTQLWGQYWNRFNTFAIPIMDVNKYFETAMAIAKTSRDEKDFERQFDKINKQRQEILLKTMQTLMKEINDRGKIIFPCEDVENIAHAACRTGCFDYFIRLVNGSVTGWVKELSEPSAEHEAHLGDDTLHNGSKATQSPNEEELKDHIKTTENAGEGESKDAKKTKDPVEEETQNLAEEDTKDRVEESQNLAPEETQNLIPKVIKDTEEDMPHMDDRGFSANKPSDCEDDVPWDCGSQWGDIEPGYYQLEAELKKWREAIKREEELKESTIFSGTYAEYMASKSNDTAHDTLNSDKSQPPSAQRLKKLKSGDAPSSDKDGGNIRAQDTPTKHLSDPSGTRGSTRSKKRVRFDDDIDSEPINHEPKRQKVENSDTATSTHQTSPLSQQTSCASASLKRARPDDNEDDEDNGFKRQKVESLSSTPTSQVTSIGSAEDHSANNPTSENPSKTAETLDTDTVINGERQGRKKGSISPSARETPPPSSSSSRRSKSPTFEELDHSGKSHSVS